MKLFESITKVFKKDEKKEPFTKDKAEWQYESCLKEYCRSNIKNENELTEKDKEFIWECSGLLISYFLTWLINNNYLNFKDIGINEDAINEIKNRKIKTSKFFGDELDYKLSRNDISEDIIDFVDDYYSSGFYNDYPNYMDKISCKNLFCTEFSWEDYDNIEKIINKAYLKFKKRRK